MSDTDPLLRVLATRFESGPKAHGRHVAFWYDETGEHSQRVDDLAAELGVTVARVEGNEFAIKHRLLIEQPTEPFIVYRDGPAPTGIDNWLLDLEYAYGVFHADKAALVGDDLGIPDAVARPIVGAHPSFFNSADRRERLKKRLGADDDEKRVLAKMSAVLLKTEQHSLSELARRLLVETAADEHTGWTQLSDHGLTGFFWEGVKNTYGYAADVPTLDDFVLWIFRRAHEGFGSDTPGRNIEIDYSRWRDSKSSGDAMAQLARHAQDVLQIRDQLADVDWTDLLEKDTFEAIDRKIIHDLAVGVAGKTISRRQVADAERKRQQSVWYREYEAQYTAIRSASELLARIDEFDPSMAGFDDGIDRYTQTWSTIDQLYRHFIKSARATDHGGLLDELGAQVENFYSHKYVDPLATAWQAQVDAVAIWTSAKVTPQRSFFAHYVQPLLDKKKRVIVIISDALRYEVASELQARLQGYRDTSKVGFNAELAPTLGVLPSYTQLGMAALLPHSTLGFSGKGSLVEADAKPTAGTAPRTKILQPHDGVAVTAADISGMAVKELRALTQQQQLMYVYHNRIDATGDKLISERQVFGAAAETIDDLVKLTKQFASAEVGAIFITADHGFLFQDRELDASGYLSVEPQGDEFLDRDRRRVIGRGLKADGAFRHFSPAQLQLSSDYEVLIPKGTKRLKLQGSGARFVHGGATLQEIVVPVISVTYTDSGKSTVQPVRVVIQQKGPNITTGVLGVEIHQVEPVGEKIQARELRAGIYLPGIAEPLSNQVMLKFNLESPEARERYVPVRMALSSDADSHNDKDVEFRLEERVRGTSHWQLVEKAVYRLKRTFQADF